MNRQALVRVARELGVAPEHLRSLILRHGLTFNVDRPGARYIADVAAHTLRRRADVLALEPDVADALRCLANQLTEGNPLNV